jgi:hypothetical protein
MRWDYNDAMTDQLSATIERVTFHNPRTQFGPILGDREGKMMALDVEGVKAINTMQIGQSRRQVFCAEDKFQLVLEYAQSHPQLFEPDRPRFEIM